MSNKLRNVRRARNVKRREHRPIRLEQLELRFALTVEPILVFDTELTSLNLSGGPYPMPLASDPTNALGDSILGYGIVNSSVSITLSSQRSPMAMPPGPGPASPGIACAGPTIQSCRGSSGQPPGPGNLNPIDPNLLDGQPFFVDSFFDVFFDITVTDVDPRPGRDFASMPDGASFLLPNNGPAHMQSIYQVLFDKDVPNYGLIPPPQVSPYIGHFNIEIPLGGDINGNGENDKLKFTLASHAAGDGNRTFTQLPNGTVIDEFDSAAFLEGAVVDVSTDPPFTLGSGSAAAPDFTGPGALTGPTTATSFLLNPVTLTGHVYHDFNGNGTQDLDGQDNMLGTSDDEVNLSGVDVLITDSDLNLQTVETDAGGDWTVDVPQGATTVDVDETDPQFTAVVPTGWSRTEGVDPQTVNALTGPPINTGNDGYFAAANLSITKADCVTSVSPGYSTTYTITVRNNGPSGAVNVVVNDTWPDALTRGALVPSQGSTTDGLDGNDFTWNIGSLTNGQTVTLVVTYTVPTSATVGPFTNTATVSSTTYDSNLTNNTASDTNSLGALFIQGTSFIDTDGDKNLDLTEAYKAGAPIELQYQGCGGSWQVVGSTTTDANGHYIFQHLAAGNYRVREGDVSGLGYMSSGTQIRSNVYAASAVDTQTIQVALVEPIVAKYQNFTSYQLVNLNRFGVVYNNNRVGQMQFRLSNNGGATYGSAINAFDIDLYHAVLASGDTYSVLPESTPRSPGVANNIGRIGFLYNQYGTAVAANSGQSTGLALAMFELVYDVSPNLTSGNFKVAANSVTIAWANYYLTQSVGKYESATFLNVDDPSVNPTDPAESSRSTGILVQGSFNFANVPVPLPSPPSLSSPVVTDPAVALRADPLDPKQTALFVQGTPGNDKIDILRIPNKSSVQVVLNGVSQGVFAPTGRIVVDAGAGNDTVTVSPTVKKSAWLYGGDGDDQLTGGGGNDMLVGGEGNDLLVGATGRDVLIGGRGADDLRATAADALVIAGYTAFDNQASALNRVLTEWSSSKTYQQRVDSLTGKSGPTDSAFVLISVGPNRTVIDDSQVDRVKTDNAKDWVFANLAGGLLDDILGK